MKNEIQNEMKKEIKTVDLIIPVYRPGREFAELLRRLKRQTYPIHRMIIINTEEEYWDKAWEEICPLSVTHITASEFNHAATRRMAAELSDAEVMVFMTQDAMPADRRLITTLVAQLYSEPDLAVAYARQLPKACCSYLEQYTRSFNYGAESRTKTEKDLAELGIKTFFCSDVCAAYRKDLYVKNGGFAVRALFGEDMLYAASAIQNGYGVRYAAEARVYHSHNYSPIQQFHRNFDLGVSQADHPEIYGKYPSEGAGISLVLNSLRFLCRQRHPEYIPELILQSGMKYLGYRLGKMYTRLPDRLILWCTTMPYYWTNNTF